MPGLDENSIPPAQGGITKRPETISGKLESLVDGAIQGQIAKPQVKHSDPLPELESPAPGSSTLDIDGTPEKYAG
tara:strand:+ start:2279 stop:2503 length:225 start_codon:yes stop_codon:yes gene_type:complete